MLPFHLQEHLLRRGMLLRFRYGGQYSPLRILAYCHPSKSKNDSYSFAFHYTLYFALLSTTTKRLALQKMARSTLTVLTVSVIITV